MLTDQLRKKIEDDVKNNKVVIYMKGTAASPMCGFSGRAVQILQSYGVALKDHDVLSDDQLRQGIKEFTNWPTIPQVFINGEFVGGADIIAEMHENGELAELLK
ncbi:MAG: Grx4 family monothiol glutaredoxin [Candidatus Omnitrophica bacterium]|nr:Grx4 family monothiol glutaredoxin [Candidatus Omnitrophota bacterium]MDE2214531.1 Grx4 family monothiol glutaredoxin [Candidatus Omnitrophota bacterium]MDE2230849.1 Grx4 family monothiol glutaredoxin [Candidatus Omnitrophota bacterium]